MKLAHFLGVTMVLGAALAAHAVEPRRPLEQVGVWNAPPVDLSGLVAERQRVGLRLAADLSPANSGTWEDGPDGSRLWRLRLRSEGALWLVLGFDSFRLPAGARLVAYDPESRRRLGPYTSNDIRPDGALWLPPLDGDEIVLELHWPARLAGTAPDLHLDTVSHGFRSLTIDLDADDSMLSPGGSSQSCNVDVACPAGQPWQDQKRGVVRMHLNGQFLCSGSLVNNTSLDCSPYILSASHCYNLGPGLTPAGTTFYFNYERPSCGGGGSALNQFITGSTLVSRSPVVGSSDFILLELSQAPPESFNVYFNGWSRAAQAASATTAIHHPAGDFKKISLNDDPVSAVFNADQISAWRVDNWELGITEDGSSGAPLFDQNQRIIGQLFGGPASCTNLGDPNVGNDFDDFGRFDLSWNGGGTPATRLRDALDPAPATGASTLNGMDSSFCGALAPLLELDGVSLDDGDGNQDGFLDPGDIGKLEVDIQNEGPLAATSVTGTLSTTDPAVTLYVDQAAWPDVPPGGSGVAPSSPFVVDVSPDLMCGSVISFQLALESAEGSWEAPFEVVTGTLGDATAVFQDDMENGVNGWTTAQLLGSNAWFQAVSGGDTIWFVGVVFNPTDTTLTIPDLAALDLDPLPGNATLRFEHVLNAENGFDGGVLEYTTNGGIVWQDAGGLITSGGYNGAISGGSQSPIAGRSAWTGDLGGSQTVVVDLASLAGQSLSLRWRFATDLAGAVGGGLGWRVDDVVLEVASAACVPPTFRGYPGARCRGFRPGQVAWDGVCAQPRPGGPRIPRTGRDPL